MTYFTTKYGFSIRSRAGMVIENLAIHGRDAADAERKLRRMYPQCQVLECRALARKAPSRAGAAAFAIERGLALMA